MADGSGELRSAGPPERPASRGRFIAFLASLPKWIAYSVVLVGALFLLYVAFRSYTFLREFNNAVDLLAGRYGVNSWLAKALAVGFFAPLAWGVKHGFFRISKHSFRTRIATGLYASAYFLGMYFVSREAAFSHSTGEVLQWYAETPEGVRFFDSPGYDPKYGLPLSPVTSEMKVALARRQLGQAPSAVLLADLATLQLFDPLTGAPRYWFFKSAAGEFELYDGPGFHPQNQQLLVPLTSQVVTEITEWLRLEKSKATEASRLAFIHRYIDTTKAVTRGVRQWLVLITDTANRLVPRLVDAGGEALARRGVSSPALFRPQLLRDKLHDGLFAGDPSLVHRLSLKRFCDGLVLGRLNTSLSASTDIQGMVTARTSMTVRLISATSGAALAEFQVASLGAGFSSEAAEEQALDRLAVALRDQLAAALP